jgi:hypothetical protein
VGDVSRFARLVKVSSHLLRCGERTSDPRLTFTAAADAWWAARVVELRPSTENAYSAALRHLRAAFRRRRLADIGPTEVARHVSQRDAKGWTVKGEMTVLSGVFTHAGRHLGHLGRTP